MLIGASILPWAWAKNSSAADMRLTSPADRQRTGQDRASSTPYQMTHNLCHHAFQGYLRSYNKSFKVCSILDLVQKQKIREKQPPFLTRPCPFALCSGNNLKFFCTLRSGLEQASKLYIAWPQVTSGSIRSEWWQRLCGTLYIGIGIEWLHLVWNY